MGRKLKNKLNSQHLQLLLTMLVFGFVGSVLLWRSFAAGPIESLQPEQGSKSGSVSTVNDNSASNGGYVRFGTVSSNKLPSHVRIMSLGDSVSYGAAYADAYRQFLLDKMQAAGGHTFQYVGSVRDNYNNQTYWNEGHSGWCIELPCIYYSQTSLLANIENWLTANPADLIIVNGGLNDLATGRSITEVQNSMQKMLTKIRQVAPNSFIVVMPAIYYISAWDPGMADWLDSYVAQRQAAGERIYHANTKHLANMQYYADEVHPNEAGYRAFADVIFGVVQPLL